MEGERSKLSENARCQKRSSSASKDARTVTVRVPINIALVKYWGKSDEAQMLPLNDSLSVTINELYATTSVSIEQCTKAPADKVMINNKTVPCGRDTRFHRVFEELRRTVDKKKQMRVNDEDKNAHEEEEFSITVRSMINFPTSAGLASSAAGFAAIAFAFKQLFELDDDRTHALARLGSGSAVRSLHGNLSLWRCTDGGVDALTPRSPILSELCAVIVVINGGEKKVSSTEGMRRTMQTSELIKARLSLANDRCTTLLEALHDNDWKRACELIMKDSNQMHALCMDSMPPIMYLDDTSRAVINAVHGWNDMEKDSDNHVAYTFDAGPNACLFMRKRIRDDFMLSTLLCEIEVSEPERCPENVQKVLDGFDENPIPFPACQYILYSDIGVAPVIVTDLQ